MNGTTSQIKIKPIRIKPIKISPVKIPQVNITGITNNPEDHFIEIILICILVVLVIVCSSVFYYKYTETVFKSPVSVNELDDLLNNINDTMTAYKVEQFANDAGTCGPDKNQQCKVSDIDNLKNEINAKMLEYDYKNPCSSTEPTCNPNNLPNIDNKYKIYKSMYNIKDELIPGKLMGYKNAKHKEYTDVAIPLYNDTGSKFNKFETVINKSYPVFSLNGSIKQSVEPTTTTTTLYQHKNYNDANNYLTKINSFDGKFEDMLDTLDRFKVTCYKGHKGTCASNVPNYDVKSEPNQTDLMDINKLNTIKTLLKTDPQKSNTKEIYFGDISQKFTANLVLKNIDGPNTVPTVVN